jgi:hypothetical protein
MAEEKDHPKELMLLMRLIDQIPTRAQLIEAGAGEKGEALVAVLADTTLARYPRMRAAGALGMFASVESRASLASAIDGDGDVEVRIQALASLVHLEGHAARPRLNALSSHAHPELRSAARRQLARLQQLESAR